MDLNRYEHNFSHEPDSLNYPVYESEDAGYEDGILYCLPDSATSSTDTPCSCAMKPSTWKMMKPAKMLVPLLTVAKIMQSLSR